MNRKISFCWMLLSASTLLNAQFSNSGNLQLHSGANVAFYGNVTNSGTFTDSSTVVTMRGSNAQTVDGSAAITFNNLTVNNTSATGVTLSQNMTVRGNLALTDGYIYSSTASLLTLTSTATTSGASNASFVSGPMSKTGNQAFEFPVGKNTAYAPVTISAPSLATDQFKAEYFEIDPDALYDVDSKDASLDHVSQCEYWTINQTAGSSGTTVTLSWNTPRSCGVDYLPDLRVARWDGTQWKDEGNGSTTGTTVSGTVASSSAINTYGVFSLASISGSNVLPIELLNFEGRCDEVYTMLSWSTASEMNNDYFTIERSTDGVNWQLSGTIKGAGNSSEFSNYTYSDSQISFGDITYYRVKQTDYDGFSKDLKTISVTNCRSNSSTENVLHVYPNPSNGVFNLACSKDAGEVESIQIFNASGREVYYAVGFQNSIDLTALEGGIYFIQLNLKTGTLLKKMTLE
ncbi:MAG: T9SS type A sorting domain-containing protein [Bacteroidetes bacterium]|nr:T9SS type A sorting domain-containing protein [Bacteroidota bacterium]